MAHPTVTLKYSPLDLAKHEIRLLRLQPRQFSSVEEIECELVQVNLDAEPQYEALSYEWGAPSESPFWISVDGELYQVQENLSDALRDLRPKSEPRMLWIDALCINQNDTMERNHQVACMGDIYRNASRVIVWIGRERLDEDGHDDALIAISFLEDTKRRSLAEFIPGCNSKRQSQLLQKGYGRAWQAVLNLCRRQYWTRLWIIQEVVLATNIIVHCGQLKVTWGVLSKLFAQLESHCLEMTFEAGDAIRSSIPARLDRQRLVRKKDQDGSPILEMMMTHADAKCVDIRDKVFGVHSLIKPCCRKAVPIDYSKTPIHLCSEVLQHHLLCHGPKKVAYVQTTQHLLKIFMDHFDHPGCHSERQHCQNLEEMLWAANASGFKSNLTTPSPETLSIRSTRKFTPSSEISFIKLNGKFKGAITWFGSASLYTQVYQPWMDEYMGKNDLGEPFRQYNLKAIPKLLDNSEWSYPRPNQALRDMILGLIKPGTRSARCKSIRSFDSYALIPSRNWAQSPFGPQNTTVSVDTLSLKVLKERLIIGAVETLQRIRRSSSYSLSNDVDGDRILGLTDGLIAFAPKDAQLGDLVCQFEGCNFFVIIREEDGAFVVDGAKKRPLFRIVGTSNMVKKPHKSPQDKGEESELEKVKLYLDVVTLQKLCWMYPTER
jgi:hypothetical protein